jgi:hypothetical protein
MPGNDRFVRWQAILREHLGYTINLFLTFSVAALGYCLSLIRDRSFTPTGFLLVIFWISVVSMWLLIFLGIVCVLNRLSDFRGTARRARLAASDPTQEKEYLDMLGGLTWRWFYGQTISFGIGATALGIVVLREYGQRLLP